jgi:hypothetical protein
MRFLKPILIILIAGILSAGLPSCGGSHKSMCMRDGTFKKYNKKSGRSKYSSQYRTKSSPVRKDYVIKNKKKR